MSGSSLKAVQPALDLYRLTNLTLMRHDFKSLETLIVGFIGFIGMWMLFELALTEPK